MTETVSIDPLDISDKKNIAAYAGKTETAYNNECRRKVSSTDHITNDYRNCNSRKVPYKIKYTTGQSDQMSRRHGRNKNPADGGNTISKKCYAHEQNDQRRAIHIVGTSNKNC